MSGVDLEGIKALGGGSRAEQLAEKMGDRLAELDQEGDYSGMKQVIEGSLGKDAVSAAELDQVVFSASPMGKISMAIGELVHS